MMLICRWWCWWWFLWRLSSHLLNPPTDCTRRAAGGDRLACTPKKNLYNGGLHKFAGCVVKAWRALESPPRVCDQAGLSWNLSNPHNHHRAAHRNLTPTRHEIPPQPTKDFCELPSNTNSVFPCILWVTLKCNGEDELSGIFCYIPTNLRQRIPLIGVTITFMTSSGMNLEFNSLVN